MYFRIVFRSRPRERLSKSVTVTHTLIEEYIGFEEIDDGVYNVYYCDYLIGRFFEEINKIKDIIERVPVRNIVVKESYRST